MRRLQTSDVFAGLRLVKEAGIRDEVKAMAAIVQKGKKVNVEEVGADFILACMEGLAGKGAEQKMYEFLAGPLEMEIEEIAKMPMLDLIETLKGFSEVEDVEGWKAFFKSLTSILK